MSNIIKVGDGLGFLVKGRESVYIITAASLLPEFDPDDRILGCFVGVIDGPQDIHAEILYVDVISGIAVLGFPRGYQMMGTTSSIDELFKSTALVNVICPPQPQEGNSGISFMAHANRTKVRVLSEGGTLHIFSPAPTAALIGAPITHKHKGVNAVGVVTNPTSLNGSMARLTGGLKGKLAAGTDTFHEGGQNPALVSHLPGWLLEELDIKSAFNVWRFKDDADCSQEGYLDGDAWAKSRGNAPADFPGHQCEQNALLRNYGRYSSCLSRLPESARKWILTSWTKEKGVLYDSTNSYLRGFLAGAAKVLKEREIGQKYTAIATEKIRFIEAVWCAIADTPFDMRRMTDFLDMFQRTGHREALFSGNRRAKQTAIDFLLEHSKVRTPK